MGTDGIATLLLNITVYGFGFYVIKRNGGIKNNLPFGFSIFLFTLYYLITPFYFFLTGRRTIWGDELFFKGVGENITGYYLIALNYYALANLLFILGYLSLKGRIFQNDNYQNINSEISTRKIGNAIIASFIVCYAIVLFNYLHEGFNPFLVLMGDSESKIYGVIATSNYLKNFADSIIAVIIIAYYYRISKWQLYPMVILAFGLFMVMGFRYRIILTILGIVFVSLYQNKKSLKVTFARVAIGIGIFYVILFITYNRMNMITGNFKELVANPAKYEFSILFEQTRGMLDDITIIKYYKTNPNAVHDHGITFLYFLVRAMPRAIVGDEFKDSFYPFPAQIIIQKAYHTQKYWGKSNTGEAPLHLAYFYIAGGLPFLLIGSLMVGRIIKWIQIRFRPDNDHNKIILILITTSLFQWITRGYFPGFVDHLAFMFMGFWMIMLLSKIIPTALH